MSLKTYYTYFSHILPMEVSFYFLFQLPSFPVSSKFYLAILALVGSLLLNQGQIVQLDDLKLFQL